MHLFQKRCFFCLIFLFIFSALKLIAVNPKASIQNQNLILPLAKENKKIAICYWGLTRSTKKVYKTHYKNLFNVLTRYHFDYDIFMHTWNIPGKQKVWNYEIDTPVDYEEYKLLKPNFYQIDEQKEFTDQLEMDKYFYKGIDDVINPWTPAIAEKLLFNHLCALESLRRVTEMVENSGNKYDIVIYVRPDVQINRRIPIIKLLDIQDFDIIIPDFDHYAGYNDRFAIMTFKTAPIYGKRINGLEEFRKTQGMAITSERYVKYVCDANHLNVILVPFYFDIIRP